MFEKLTTALLLANSEAKVEEWIDAWMQEAIQSGRLRHRIGVLRKIIIDQLATIKKLELEVERLCIDKALLQAKIRMNDYIIEQLEAALLDEPWPAWVWLLIGCAVSLGAWGLCTAWGG